jgi:hypothetical protein
MDLGVNVEQLDHDQRSESDGHNVHEGVIEKYHSEHDNHASL